MANTYRALSPAAVAAYEDGVFERDFTVLEEKDALASGLVEIVPRKYRVLTNSFDAAGQGGEFEAAYPVETEAALLSGGHIERVDTTDFDAEVELEQLRAEAEESGVKVDKRWKADRLRDEIAAAQDESVELPADGPTTKKASN